MKNLSIKNLRIQNQIINLYEMLFSKVSGYREYSFSPTPKQQKQVENFTVLLSKKIGENAIDSGFIFDFMCFQFNLRKDQKTRFGKGMVMLNHVIGNKAIDLWIKKGDSWKFHVEKFIKEFRIHRPVEESKIQDTDALQSGEERTRAMFLNQDEGLEVCVNTTTLFHPNSDSCLKCSVKLECQSIQLDIYPDIYHKRKVGV